MELLERKLIESPLTADRVRLQGRVRYEDGQEEDYWFEFPTRLADAISLTGTPWVTCFLPLAMTLGEPIRVGEPVDPVLLEHLPELMEIWHTWYPRLKVVPIEAPAGRDPGLHPERNAAFFSGGLDSFFTAIRHHDGIDTWKTPLHDLICIGGFDIPLANGERFKHLRARLQEAAASLAMELVEVWSNVRETRCKPLPWADLHFGSVLVSIALAMEKRYRRIFIPSSYTYNSLHPVGSHPLTDPLWSTTYTRFNHDGAAYNRSQKAELIVKHPLALKLLHVCFVLGTDENCGDCNKCCRTMAALELFGGLNGHSPFKKAFDPRRLGQIYCMDHTDRAAMLQLRELAVQKHRPDIVRAANHSLRMSAFLDRVLPMTNWLGRRPWPVGKVGRRIGQKLLDRVIDK